MKIWKIVLFSLLILTIFVFSLSYFSLLKTEYEISEDSYYYTLSTIPQVIATLIGLIAIFSIYILEGKKKERVPSGRSEEITAGVYFFLILILLLGSVTIIYSLFYLPLFWLVENPLLILMIATMGSTGLLSSIIIFVLYTHFTDEI